MTDGGTATPQASSSVRVSRAHGACSVVFVHPPLSVALRRGLTVRDEAGREGEIAGFKVERSWFGRGRSDVTRWVIVKFPHSGRCLFAPADLRVVEREGPAC